MERLKSYKKQSKVEQGRPEERVGRKRKKKWGRKNREKKGGDGCLLFVCFSFSFFCFHLPTLHCHSHWQSQAAMFAHFVAFLFFFFPPSLTLSDLFLLFFSSQKDISFFFITLSIIIITKTKDEGYENFPSPIPKLPLQALKKGEIIIKPQIRKLWPTSKKETLPCHTTHQKFQRSREGRRRERKLREREICLSSVLFTDCPSQVPSWSLERKKNKYKIIIKKKKWRKMDITGYNRLFYCTRTVHHTCSSRFSLQQKHIISPRNFFFALW